MLTTIYLIGLYDIESFEEKLFLVLLWVDSSVMGVAVGAVLAYYF
jgi:hypothetical protein